MHWIFIVLLRLFSQMCWFYMLYFIYSRWYLIHGLNLSINVTVRNTYFPFTIKPFVLSAPLLYPVKTSENRKVFWCFQGVEKDALRTNELKKSKMVNQYIVHVSIYEVPCSENYQKTVSNFLGAFSHCVKSVRIRSFSGPYFPVFTPNAGKYGPEKTPYLDTFHAVRRLFFH